MEIGSINRMAPTGISISKQWMNQELKNFIKNIREKNVSKNFEYVLLLTEAIICVWKWLKLNEIF